MSKCKTCINWKNVENHEDGFLIGLCSKEPFDAIEMASDQMAVQCGWEGSISVGENFGCIHYEPKA